MADPLSVAASVAGLVTLGAAIAKGLYKVADAMRSTGEEIRAYADEITAFQSLLSMIDIELRRSKDIGNDILVFEQLSAVCGKVLNPFRRLDTLLQDLLRRFRCHSKWDLFCVKIQYIFRTQRDLLFWRDTLSKQHTTLNGALTVLIARRNRQDSAQMNHILKQAVEHTTIELRSVIQSYASTTLSYLEPPRDTSTVTGILPNGHRQEDETSLSESHVVAYNNDINTTNDLSTSTDMTPQMASSNVCNPQDLTVFNVPGTALTIRSSHDVEADQMEDIEDLVAEWVNWDAANSMVQLVQQSRSVAREVLDLSYNLLYTLDQQPLDPSQFQARTAGKNGKYSIGIVCTSEFQLVAMRLFMEVSKPKVFDLRQGRIYVVGRMGDHELVLAYAATDPKQHDEFQAEIKDIYRQMLEDIPNMLFAISLGTCNAVSPDIRHGDIVVGHANRDGNTVVELQTGLKTRWQPTARPPNILQSVISRFMMSSVFEEGQEFYNICLQAIHNLKSGKSRRWHSNLQCARSAKVWYGTIVAGGIGSYTYDSDTLLEEYGVLCSDNEPLTDCYMLPTLLVRGVSERFNDEFDFEYDRSASYDVHHQLALLSAAAYVKVLLEELPQVEVGSQA